MFLEDTGRHLYAAALRKMNDNSPTFSTSLFRFLYPAYLHGILAPGFHRKKQEA